MFTVILDNCVCRINTLMNELSISTDVSDVNGNPIQTPEYMINDVIIDLSRLSDTRYIQEYINGNTKGVYYSDTISDLFKLILTIDDISDKLYTDDDMESSLNKHHELVNSVYEVLYDIRNENPILGAIFGDSCIENYHFLITLISFRVGMITRLTV